MKRTNAAFQPKIKQRSTLTVRLINASSTVHLRSIYGSSTVHLKKWHILWALQMPECTTSGYSDILWYWFGFKSRGRYNYCRNKACFVSAN